jgi:hypothetical protein
MADGNKKSGRNESAKTLIWLAGALILCGLVVMSPAAGLFCFALAVMSAAGAMALALTTTVRIVSILVAVGALAMTVVTWPDYQTHMQQYRGSINN